MFALGTLAIVINKNNSYYGHCGTVVREVTKVAVVYLQFLGESTPRQFADIEIKPTTPYIHRSMSDLMEHLRDRTMWCNWNL